MRRKYFLCTLLAATTFSSANAGTFTMDDVWYRVVEGASRTNVAAGSRATYDGSVDSNDDFWAIEANIIKDPFGMAMIHYGSANQSAGIEPGQVIECSAEQCGTRSSTTVRN